MKAQKRTKTVLIRHPQAVRLVKEWARRELRSAANAAATTIIEGLGGKEAEAETAQGDNFRHSITEKATDRQEEKRGAKI